MCHSSAPWRGRTQPPPRKPGKSSAMVSPAWIQAVISRAWAGSARRVNETVTGSSGVSAAAGTPVGRPVLPASLPGVTDAWHQVRRGGEPAHREAGDDRPVEALDRFWTRVSATSPPLPGWLLVLSAVVAGVLVLSPT